MDRINLESSNWLHKDQPGLQKLLRRTYGVETAGYGSKKLCEWVRTDFTRAVPDFAVEMEIATNDICEFNE
jgi:hypothetical protein